MSRSITEAEYKAIADATGYVDTYPTDGIKYIDPKGSKVMV
jgi:hypothetical protein